MCKSPLVGYLVKYFKHSNQYPMKACIWSAIAGILVLFSFCAPKEKDIETSQAPTYGQVSSNFQDPPREYGVNCWWWWLNGNVNKAAITKDLEAMKSRNFQGAMIFDAGGHNQRGNRDIPQGPLFGSDRLERIVCFCPG